MREAESLQAPGVELDAGLLGLAQHVHERQLDLAQQALEAALGELLGLALREVVDQHGARRRGSSASTAMPRSSQSSSSG